MSDENKIYVGGLAAETTSESLWNHFSQYGEITDCIVMPDKVTGRSRCFGFVSYKDPASTNAALGTSNVVDGREVSCKKAVREGPAALPQVTDGVYNVVKIFVGGLPATCDHNKFVAYFERFGTIEDAVVMMDNQTQRHRGFGYVTFSETSAVDATLQNYAANQIDGKWIEVKRCIPQDKMAPGQSLKGGGKAKGGGKGFPANGKGGGYVIGPRGAAGALGMAPAAAAPFVPFDGPCAGFGTVIAAASSPYGAGYAGGAGQQLHDAYAAAAYAPQYQQPRPQLRQQLQQQLLQQQLQHRGGGLSATGAALLAAADAAVAAAAVGGYRDGGGASQGIYSAPPQQTRYGDQRPGPY